MLSDLAKRVSTRKENYAHRSSRVSTVGGGSEVAILEYDHTNEGTALVDREMLMPAVGAHMLYVTASTAKAGARKYQSIFDRVLASVSF